MKLPLVVVSLLAVGGSTLLTTSCASRGTAEDYTWHLECPKTVEPGSEFEFAVRAIDSAGQAADGVKVRYNIQWAGGSYAPFRHSAASGTAVKIRARRDSGPASLVITCKNRLGEETRVAEAEFQVK